MVRPIGVDLFAGAGGLSLGFEQAGFDVVAAVERDPVHASVHHFNFPRCAIIPLAVEDVSGKDVRERASIGDRAIDVVFGGAPCQGFSMIGQRALEDPRNRLVKEFVRLVSELEPSYFVFENVKGLTVGKHRQFLRELICEFEERGYAVRQPWRVLNAANFNVPQDRERLILLGAKRPLAVPEYPAVQTVMASAGPEAELPLLPRSPTCKEALADLPEAEEFAELLRDDEAVASSWGSPSDYARMMRCVSEAAWGFGYPRQFNPEVLTSSMRTGHSKISRRRFDSTAPGSVEPISRFFRLPPNGVCNTLRAGTDSSRGAFTSPRPIHYERARCITVREMARLHGFPDWFRFHRTKWHGARQVGNAVPPPMGRAVASELIRSMGISPDTPTEVLQLGDPTELALGMKAAADRWSIAVPIAKRDRKNGLKKRKQHEIELEMAQSHKEL